jgi:DNA-binding MarR family transcriptional regulator
MHGNLAGRRRVVNGITCIVHTKMKDEPLQILRDLITRINRPRMHAFIMKRAGVSLDRALFPLLGHISKAGPIGVAELADAVNLDQSTVSRQLAKLESLGLVERSTNPSDQRVRQAVLTDAGRQIAARVQKVFAWLKEQVLADWSDAEKTQLAKLLRKLSDSLERVTGDEGTSETPRCQ